MGGQNSKLTPEAEAMPPRVRPLLQRKFEEIKNRIRARRLRHDVAPSKKQLLKSEDNEEEGSASEFQSLQSSPENSVAPPKVQTLPEKKSSKVAPVLVDHDEITDQKNKKEVNKLDGSIEEHKEKESGEVAKVVPVYIGGVFALEQGTDGEEENADQEDMRSISYQMFECPSPSFRVYCQEPMELEDELEKETDKDGSKHDNTHSTDEEMNHQKTPTANNDDDSITDNDDTKTKKKARRSRRRMKNPFQMNPFQTRGAADCSVKNMLKVRGCAGHDRATLLAEKSAPT